KGETEKWTKLFKDKLAKNTKLLKAMERAGWRMEQRLAVPIAKGAAEALGRKAMTQTAEQIAEKAAREAAEAGARAASKKVASKVLKSAATKLAGGLVG